MQTQDADAMTYLKYFTFLSHDKLAELEQSLKTEPEKRLAQTTLAREVTQLVHGEGELKRAEAATQALFGEGIKDLDEATLLDVLGGAPATNKSKDALGSGIPLVDLLVDTQLCPSKGQARKDVAAGGVYINNERVSDVNATVGSGSLIAGRHLVLRKGKKNYHLVSFG